MTVKTNTTQRIPLSIPDWCPVNVSSLAQTLYIKYRASPAGAELIERLATSPKMKLVWNELRKRERNNHQKTDVARHKASHLVRDQDEAIKELFLHAFNVGLSALELPPQNSDWVQQAAQKLREDAARISKLHPRKLALPISRCLFKAAKAYERLQYKIHDQIPGVATNIVTCTKAIFGKSMYETAATITGVIMESEVTGRMVRTWETALNRPRRTTKLDPANIGKN